MASPLNEIPNYQIPGELADREVDILAFGSAVLEQVVQVENYPEAGQHSLNIREMVFTAGGCAVNVACYAGRIGASAGIISVLGEGKYGSQVRDELARSNVLNNTVIEIPGKDGILVIELTNQAGDWTTMTYSDGDMALQPEHVPAVLEFKRAKVLHIDGYAFLSSGSEAAVEKALRNGRKAGCVISFDACVPAAKEKPEFLGWLASQADIVFANEFEAMAATRTASVKDAIEKVRHGGPELAVIKLGAGGSILVTPEQTGHIPAYQVDIVDTVAAGDAYIGTCLSCLCRGESLHQAATRGSAAGALACLGHGSLSYRFDLEDIDRLVRTGVKIPTNITL